MIYFLGFRVSRVYLTRISADDLSLCSTRILECWWAIPSFKKWEYAQHCVHLVGTQQGAILFTNSGISSWHENIARMAFYNFLAKPLIIHTWLIPGGTELSPHLVIFGAWAKSFLGLQSAAVRSCQWDPQRTQLVISTGGNKIYLWSPDGASCVHVPVQAFNVFTAHWSPKGGALLLTDKESFCCAYMGQSV